jgi:serine O-acetyltransferase
MLQIAESRSLRNMDWGIDSVIAELRALRTSSASPRFSGRPRKLPSQKAMSAIADNLSAVLFPNRLGLPELTDEGVDYFVGNTLDVALNDLMEQVRRELHFSADLGADDEEILDQAIDITRRFGSHLPQVRRLLESDVRAAYRGDPAARSVDEVLVCYPGVTAITHHRLAHLLSNLGVPLLARIVAEIAHSRTGIDIHPAAQIGGSFFIDHGTGVVIGESSVIGERVRLYQAVTLGAKRFSRHEDGALVKGEARHPIVEDDVVIYAGATILGRITIGRGSTIGGNVWLTRSVPPDSNITQAKVRNEAFDEGGGI